MALRAPDLQLFAVPASLIGMQVRGRSTLVWASSAILVLAAGSLGAGSRLLPGGRTQDSTRHAARAPVVVELFTSEGCSSCPPADAFLSRLEQQQPVPAAEVIALEEHVDYWDQLGWRDPFSSPDWTERQRRYAQALGTGSIYTPQMIVNGSTEFVGSRERRGKDAIEKAAQQATIPLTVNATAATGGHAADVTVQVGPWEGTPAKDQLELWLAVTETGLHSAVSHGENAGETLYHAAVVRKLQKVGTVAPKQNVGDGKTPALTAKVSLDSEWKRENLHVVAFIQGRRSLRILGAARAPLSQ